MIAGVLIGEDADDAAGAKELDGLAEALLTVEELDAGAAAFLADMGVDGAVPERLVNGAERDVTEVFREDLREEFPIAEVAQGYHDGAAGAELRMHEVFAFEGNAFRHLLERHGAEFDGGEEVGAETCEMAAGEAVQLGV